MVSVESRPLSQRETELTKSLTSINPEWAEVDATALRVIAECRCGCQSIVFAEPLEPQNIRAVGHQGLVGQMNLKISVDGREDVISVLLHFAEGSLSLLEVIWYNFPDPIPTEWREIGREVSGRE